MSEDFDIEELLRTHLLDDQEAPPSDLFDLIDAQLSEKRRKRRFFWWFWFGLGSCVFLAFVFGSVQFVYFNQLVTIKGKPASENAQLVKERSTFHSENKDATALNLEDVSLSTESTDIIEQPSYTRKGDLKQKNGSLSKPIENESSLVDEHKQKSGTQTQLIKNKLDATQHLVLVEKENNELNQDEKTENSIEKADELNRLKEETTLQENQINNDAALSQKNSDSTQIVKDADTTLIVKVEISSNDSIPDTIAKLPPDKNTKEYKFGLLLYGGPSLFDIAVFKPYFSSGALSNVAFPSTGYEMGFGFYRQLKKRFTLQVLANYSALKTQFNYDLMISENDFFELYEDEKPIPLENLDDPESCNCFLAEDVALNYKVSNFSFLLGSSYEFIQQPKFVFGTEFALSSILSTKFSNISSSKVLFPQNQSEKFISFGLQFGLGFHYKINDRMLLGLSPSYNIQFNTKSTIYAKNFNRILIPISLKFRF